MKWDKKICRRTEFRKFGKWDVIVYRGDVAPLGGDGTYLVEADLCNGILDFAGSATMYDNGSIKPDKVVENDHVKCFGWFTQSVEPLFFEYWKEFYGPFEEVNIFQAKRVWDSFADIMRGMTDEI